MQHKISKRQRKTEQSGFTLVELAIVMLIIGLLLAGAMKWQEFINNGKITSTITHINNFKDATETFQDTYNALPGDMSTAQTRLRNCDGTAATECYNAGTNPGDTMADLNVGPADGLGDAIALTTEERVQFWRHLLAAELITGVKASGNLQWGEMMPASPWGGGWRVGDEVDGTTVRAGEGTESADGGVYLELANNPVAAATAANAGELPLTQIRASVIDRKIDDGISTSGIVLGYGPGSCFDVGGPASGYDEPADTLDCGIYVLIYD